MKKRRKNKLKNKKNKKTKTKKQKKNKKPRKKKTDTNKQVINSFYWSQFTNEQSHENLRDV